MQQQCARVVVRFRESHLFIITFQHYYLSTLAPGYNICFAVAGIRSSHVCIGCLRQPAAHQHAIVGVLIVAGRIATEYVNIAYLIF